MKTASIIVIAAAVVGAAAGLGQAEAYGPRSIGTTPMTFARPSGMVTPLKGQSPAAGTLVRNRARELGTRPSGNGTRYFAVRDADLQGVRSSEEILRRLTPPPVGADDGVKAYEVSIELRQPIHLRVDSRTEVRIGTVVSAPEVRSLAVRSSIDARLIHVSPR